MGLFSSLVKAIFTSNGASTSVCAPSTEGVSDSAAMSARNGRHPAARVIDIDGDTEKVIYTSEREFQKSGKTEPESSSMRPQAKCG